MSVVHGGLDERELRALDLDPADVLDLSANLHPAGPSPAVLEAARGARLDRYPPADAAPLREAIAAHEDVPPDWVLPTPGATAAIHLVARSLLAPGARAVVLEPAFGEYEVAMRSAGAEVVHVTTAAPRFAAPRELPEATLAFVTNPNNPTGTHLERGHLERWLSPDRVLVLDAAYESFVPRGWDAVDLLRDGGNVLVVRSMTKLHAIPGVRLGYVVAAPEVIARLTSLQHSWSLDAVAHAVGPVALAEHDERIALLDSVWSTRERMRQALASAGCTLGPSRANFLLVEVGEASDFRSRLLRRGVLVRDCTSFGLPSWVRVAVPGEDDEERVTEALLRTLQEGRAG